MAAPNPFYDQGALGQIANNLFLGWGYDFYRAENQLRADDQLVRAKARELLGRATASVQAAEAAYRREALPPPSREKPFPDPQAIQSAQALERLGREIAAVSGRLHALPAPGQDLMSLLYRQEAQTLAGLVEIDSRLMGQAELLRAMVEDRPAAWLLENAALIESGLAALQATLADRGALLLSGGPPR